MTIRILILLGSIILMAAIALAMKFRPDLIEKINSYTAKKSNSAVGIGAGVGIALGVGLGASLDDVGAGVAVGMCIGAAFGAAISKRQTSS